MQTPGNSRCTPPSSWGVNAVQSHATPGKHERHAERCEPRGRHGDHSSAGTAAGGSRRTQPQPQPASKVVPTAVSARGSFGLATSPSAKALEANDTGDRVTCPVCHRGMDHWKSGQRQQVICSDQDIVYVVFCTQLCGFSPTVGVYLLSTPMIKGAWYPMCLHYVFPRAVPMYV